MKSAAFANRIVPNTNTAGNASSVNWTTWIFDIQETFYGIWISQGLNMWGNCKNGYVIFNIQTTALSCVLKIILMFVLFLNEEEYVAEEVHLS